MKEFVIRGLALDRLESKKQLLLDLPVVPSRQNLKQQALTSLEYMNALTNTLVFRIGGLMFVAQVTFFKGLDIFVLR